MPRPRPAWRGARRLHPDPRTGQLPATAGSPLHPSAGRGACLAETAQAPESQSEPTGLRRESRGQAGAGQGLGKSPLLEGAALVRHCNCFLNLRCHETRKREVRSWRETLGCRREDSELPGTEAGWERRCRRCPVGGWTLERQECISERVNSAARAPAPRCLPRSLHFYADWKPALCVLLKLNVRLLILLLVSNEI